MIVDYNDIGKRIREARVKKKVTQEQLAEMVGVGVTHISHIETGNSIPSMKVFILIVNALGVSADELLCGSLQQSSAVYKKEISDFLDDCTLRERRIISEIAKTVKLAIRKNS